MICSFSLGLTNVFIWPSRRKDARRRVARGLRAVRPVSSQLMASLHNVLKMLAYCEASCWTARLRRQRRRRVCSCFEPIHASAVWRGVSLRFATLATCDSQLPTPSSARHGTSFEAAKRSHHCNKWRASSSFPRSAPRSLVVSVALMWHWRLREARGIILTRMPVCQSV